MDPILREILSGGVTLEVIGPDRIQAAGTLTARVRDLIRENKLALLVELASKAHYRWRVTDPDGATIEVCCLPEMILSEVAERYPGAKISPLLPEVVTAEMEAA